MFRRVSQPPPPADRIPPVLRARLDVAREALLAVHKALLDHERVGYERTMGPIESAGRLLQLVIHDPWFAWLHALSEMVVRIDQVIDEPASTSGDGAALFDQVGRLLTASEDGDGFARRYFDALQRQPAVVLAHADVRRTLKGTR